MNSYNIYVQTEQEKYSIIADIRATGAILTAVSGCGTGYYIQLNATPDQVYILNKKLGGVA